VDGSTLIGNPAVTVTVSVVGTSPGIQRMVFYLNSAYLLTDYQSPYTFTLPTERWIDGGYTLSVEALMRDAFVTQQASLNVGFNNGVITPQPISTHCRQTPGER
jgi:hypothetical protein